MNETLRILMVFACLSTVASAAPPLTTHVKEGRMRIFYTTEGKEAVRPDDENENGVPDQVENVAVQSYAAYELFVKVLKFQDPLESERYKGVDFIDISIRHADSINGLKGVAYDEIQQLGRAIDPPGTRQLTIGIATSVHAPINPTPAHEVFHLIQYSSTYFKNRWMLEGMARWAEHALGKGGLGEYRYAPKGPWPQRDADRMKLYKMTYESEFYLWNPLAAANGRASVISRRLTPAGLRKRTYTNGKPVLEDTSLRGYRLMVDILKELGAADDVAKKEQSYDSWLEVNQKSQANNAYIYDAVMKAARARSRR